MVNIQRTEIPLVGGAIVVVAKCPIAGSCKTRLVPMLGNDGAASLARAMLSDVLTSICGCPNLDGTLKVLLYAPGTKDGEMRMSSILRSLDMPYVSSPSPSSPVLHTVLVNNGWVLLPVYDPSASSSDDLSSLLADALDKTRELLNETTMSRRKASSSVPKRTFVAKDDDNGAVLFLGMDSPELSMEEVVYGLGISSGIGRLRLDGGGAGRRRGRTGRMRNDDEDDEHDDDNGADDDGNVECSTTFVGKAHMCPANDGGYGLLSIPKHASSARVFSGVRWSQPLTAISQLKALTDMDDVGVSIGTLMFDVDEPSDVRDLVNRLTMRREREGNNNDEDEQTSTAAGREGGDTLTRRSSSFYGGGIGSVVSTGVRGPFPHHTWRALLELNVIQE